jgi:hypothetical protein
VAQLRFITRLMGGLRALVARHNTPTTRALARKGCIAQSSFLWTVTQRGRDVRSARGKLRKDR